MNGSEQLTMLLARRFRRRDPVAFAMRTCSPSLRRVSVHQVIDVAREPVAVVNRVRLQGSVE